MSLESIIVTITPDRLREIQRLPVIPAHAVYRMGRGPHLFRANGSSAPRGGMMLLDCRTFDGLGAAPPFCQEVIQECSARGFTGVVCDFEAGRLPPLEQVVRELGGQCRRRNWTLIVPEQYGHCSEHALVMISSALSGGSLRQRLQEAQERFGHLINAFKFGAPPHGGLAYGLDRLCMLMAGAESIRDVIAFPKVQNASEPMTSCPDFVDDKQLDELNLNVTRREETSDEE
jgi:hypothetical protein